MNDTELDALIEEQLTRKLIAHATEWQREAGLPVDEDAIRHRLDEIHASTALDQPKHVRVAGYVALAELLAGKEEPKLL